jgi:TolB-like protein/Tfp pilus assembly protein PilF
MSRDHPYVSSAPKAVFLSYASQDAEVARRLCDTLRAVGVEVWFDQSELRGGDAWDASIRRQIKECALFVPVISANTQTRSEGYFRLEWKLAVDRSHLMADDQAFLLPVVIDTTLDANARVPDKFRDVQWTRLPAGEAPPAFAEHVCRLLSGGAAPAPVAPPRAVSTTTPAAGAEPLSIAVLPFVNRSRDEEDEYFSDGLADELLNVLAKIRGLRVAARTSAFTFKGKASTVAEIGRTLNVATVLEGSVRKAGNRMRISVQLVKVADGYQLWSESYDRTLEDIFAVQDDIAQSVVKELRAALLGKAADAIADRAASAAVTAAVKGRAKDPEAFRLYLQARHLIERYTRADTARGIEYLEQALKLDPEFALAWAELARGCSSEAGSSWVPVAEAFGRARNAVGRALALEPTLAEGHAQLGLIQRYHNWDWVGAEASYRRALELAPGNMLVLRGVGGLDSTLGRLDEAIDIYRRVIMQDPLNAATYISLGRALGAASSYAEAEAAYRKGLELSPDRVLAHANFALNQLAQGRDEEALAEALLEPERWARLWALAIIHHAARRQSDADTALRELIAKYAELAPYQVSHIYAARSEGDLAFAWLERAYVQRDTGLADMKVEPLFRSLHADPRWGAFLRKMGLAD